MSYRKGDRVRLLKHWEGFGTVLDDDGGGMIAVEQVVPGGGRRYGLFLRDELELERRKSLTGSEAALGFGRGDEDYAATITKLHRRIDNRKKQIAQDRERIAALEKALAEQIAVNADVRRQLRSVQARCYALERGLPPPRART